MLNITGIRFQQNGKMIYYNAADFQLKIGDYVIAEGNEGPELGEVLLDSMEVEESSVGNPLPKIIRPATQQDIQNAANNRAREKEAYKVCQRKIVEHKLEMKLVSVESALDNSKLLFYFTANGRVDFRALVKDLASTFKTRIELRQIGVRDEARMLGGLGPCGRPICCGSFLRDFQPVSIKMAKEQNLSLNPTKISGVCGRLMCCLKYEQDQYEKIRQSMPRIGKEISTPDGSGIVAGINVIKETVQVRISNGDASELKEYSIDSLARPQNQASFNPENQESVQPETANKEELQQENRQERPPERRRNPNQAQVRPPKVKPENSAKQNGRGNSSQESDRKGEGRTEPRKAAAKQKKSAPNLGKPVQRENPNRDKQPEKKEKPKTKDWADAVDKALRAADQ